MISCPCCSAEMRPSDAEIVDEGYSVEVVIRCGECESPDAWRSAFIGPDKFYSAEDQGASQEGGDV